MSDLPKVTKSDNFVPRRSGKAPEISIFAQKCALLSQFFKEKGTLGGASLPTMMGKVTTEGAPTTMDLLPNIGKSGESSQQNESAASPSVIKPVDFVPIFSDHFPSPDSDHRKSSSGEADSTAQMTIFYAGRVFVLDEFPANKVKDIMLLASRGSSHNTSKCFPSTSGDGKHNPGSSVLTSCSNTSIPRTNSTEDKIFHQPLTNSSDMPIARRASLHRFLGKRKERFTAKAPYQANNDPTTPHTREAGIQWIDLEDQPSKHLDLNLNDTL